MTIEPQAVGKLVVCPSPIGNLGDVTLRVLDALRAADCIACEDTRRTKVLLERHGLQGVGKLLSFHEHNERERSRELLERMREGATVALVSDAGMPSISDPGLLLVRACIDASVLIDVLPGPSAVMVALVLSGLPAQRFTFVGFMPRARGERSEVLMRANETLVAFESPNRLQATLGLLAELDPEREVAVCRELTKLHEEVSRGSASALAEHYSEHPARGEIVLVVGAARAANADHEQALLAVKSLVEAGAKPRKAASVVSGLSGVAANELYRALTASR